MKFTNPTREQFKAIHGLPPDAPICMLNLLKFREQASYDPGNTEDARQAISGRDAYGLYSKEAEAVFRRAGGYQLWLGMPEATLTGPVEEQWSLAFVAYYPTVKAFVDMVKSAEYQKATRHRTAALSDSRLVVCSPLEVGPSFAPLSYTTY